MKILFVADGRSPISLSWIKSLRLRTDWELVWFATNGVPTECIDGVKVYTMTAKDVSAEVSLRGGRHSTRSWIARELSQSALGVWLFNNMALPVRAIAAAAFLARVLRYERPRLVHALRVPIEGQIAALAGAAPLVTSIWGNDFTLYAAESMVQKLFTRFVLRRTVALFADCETDVNRSRCLGYSAERPSCVVPGNGGLSDSFGRKRNNREEIRRRFGFGPDDVIVLNMRGFRRYIRNDTFFDAVRVICKRHKNVKFVGVGMRGWATAEDIASELSSQGGLSLTGMLSTLEMEELCAACDVSISLSTHDGTPNTLLEAMAMGLVPICGDLPSIREWLDHGVNGLLVNPGDVDAVVAAVERATFDLRFREAVIAKNRVLVDEKARQARCAPAVVALYRKVSEGTAGCDSSRSLKRVF